MPLNLKHTLFASHQTWHAHSSWHQRRTVASFSTLQSPASLTTPRSYQLHADGACQVYVAVPGPRLVAAGCTRLAPTPAPAPGLAPALTTPAGRGPAPTPAPAPARLPASTIGVFAAIFALQCVHNFADEMTITSMCSHRCYEVILYSSKLSSWRVHEELFYNVGTELQRTTTGERRACGRACGCANRRACACIRGCACCCAGAAEGRSSRQRCECC